MMSMDQSYMVLEKKLNTRFENHISSDTNFSHPAEKESRQQKDDSNRGTHGWYNKCMPLNVTWEKNYQDCANT